MKKFLLIAAFSITLSGFAQSFSMGNNNISVGYGIGNFTKTVFKSYQSYDNYTYKAMGPLFFKYEHAINDKIGLGINIAYLGAKASYVDKSVLVDTTKLIYYKETISYSTYSILARMNFHFGNGDKFDPYMGIGLGYRGATWKYEDNDPNYDNDSQVSNLFPLGFETTIGARYYFTPAIGAYTEVGIAKAVVQFGITANL